MTLIWDICRFCGWNITPGGTYWYDQDGWAGSIYRTDTWHDHRPRVTRVVEQVAGERSERIKPAAR